MLAGYKTLSISTVLASLVVIITTGAAEAHGSFSGPPGLFAGLSHPFTVPAHLLAMIALALLCGQQKQPCLKTLFPWYSAALVAGLLVSLGGLEIASITIILYILAGTSGLLVALKQPLSIKILIALTIPAVFLIGLDSALTGKNWPVTFSTLGGTAITVALFYLYLATITGIIYREKPQWMRIAVRIAGSWIAAISALLISLILVG